MDLDINKYFEPTTEGIYELNRNLEINEVSHRKPPPLAGKRKRESQ